MASYENEAECQYHLPNRNIRQSFWSIVNLQQCYVPDCHLLSGSARPKIEQQWRELSFINDESNGDKHPIVNMKIIDYLIKKTLRKRNILILNLNKCNLDDGAIKLLAQGNWVCLQHLSLFCNQLTSASFESFLKGKWKNLLQIDLSKNKFENQKGETLASCEWIQLTHLDLSLNEAKLTFIEKLARNRWKNLKQINLSCNLLNNSALVNLVSMDWQCLEKINLERNCLTNDGMKVLVKGQWLKLQYMNLNTNFISVEGVKHLAANSWSDSLEIELICLVDFHYNIICLDLAKVENLRKCLEMFKSKQKKMSLVFNGVNNFQEIDESIKAALRLREIDFVI